MDVNKSLQNKRCALNLSICADNHLVAENNDEIAAVKKLRRL